MKTTMFIFLMASAALAQAQYPEGRPIPGCGPNEIKFNVKTEKAAPPLQQPEAGKALVYFIEDDSDENTYPRPTVRAGLDGNWVGATHGNSFFNFSVDPGEHTLCASWQAWNAIPPGRVLGVVHFNAVPGKVYYFSARNIYRAEFHRPPVMEFVRVDEQQGQMLAEKRSLSTSHPK